MSNNMQQVDTDMPAVIDIGTGDLDDPAAQVEGQMSSLGVNNDDIATTVTIGEDGFPRQRIESNESIQGKLTNLVWQDSKRRACHYFSVYGNIDVLRPYFDVEPGEVVARLLGSLTPSTSALALPGFRGGPGGGGGASAPDRLHRELYGPSMVILTLISLLLLQMKTSDHYVQEGTLIGTAFTVCFGYWFLASAVLWFTSNFTNTHVTGVQLLSLVGYSLFGHCLVVFISTVYHSHQSHAVFYTTCFVLGGLSSARLASVLSSKTSSRKSKIVISMVAVAGHMMFLLYLHFAYHLIVQDISLLVEKPIMPLPDSIIPASVMSALRRLTTSPSTPLPPLASTSQTLAHFAGRNDTLTL